MKNQKLLRAPEESVKPIYDGSIWLETFLDPELLANATDFAIQALEDYCFDTIAFRGMSGALIAPCVAMALNKQMIMVRKNDTSTHSTYPVEGNCASQTYVILDDFVDTGATKDAIIEAVKEFAPQAQCLGVLEVQLMNQAKIAARRQAGELYPLV